MSLWVCVYVCIYVRKSIIVTVTYIVLQTNVHGGFRCIHPGNLNPYDLNRKV